MNKNIIYILTVFLIINCYAGYNAKYFVNGELTQFNSVSNTSILSADVNKSSENTFSIGTFNVAIFYLQIFKFRYFEPTNFTKERLQNLPNYIRDSNIDIIGIQEIYKEKDKLHLIDKLKDIYPYCVYYDRKFATGLMFKNGLLFFSKIPIKSAQFALFDDNILIEKLTVDKGILSIQVEIAGHDVIVTNTHTTVGGLSFANSDKAQIVRKEQLEQVIELTQSSQVPLQIILGDFNSGKCLAENNYQYMLDNNFIDTYLHNCIKFCDAVTWDPKNKLNIDSYYENCQPQRIDNIFVNPKLLESFKITDSYVLRDTNSLLINSIEYPQSDHYGYFIYMKASQNR